MSGTPVRVFVNEHAVEVPPGTTARSAVLQFDGRLAERLNAGSAYVTDGRGVQLDPDTLLEQGSILRVVVSSRQRPESPAPDG